MCPRHLVRLIVFVGLSIMYARHSGYAPIGDSNIGKPTRVYTGDTRHQHGVRLEPTDHLSHRREVGDDPLALCASCHMRLYALRLIRLQAIRTPGRKRLERGMGMVGRGMIEGISVRHASSSLSSCWRSSSASRSLRRYCARKRARPRASLVLAPLSETPNASAISAQVIP